MSKKVAVKGLEGVALAETPDYIRQDGPAKGNEYVGKGDIVVPRLKLLQDGNSELDSNDPSFIEGAKAGMMCNSVTQELYGDAVYFVPVSFYNAHLVWVGKIGDSGPRGFRGEYMSREEAEASILQLPENERDRAEIHETPTHVLIVLKDDGALDTVAVPMPGTKAKTSRALNSRVLSTGMDRWAGKYVLGSVKTSNEKGRFYIFTLGGAGWATEDAYNRAKKWHADFSGKDITTDYRADDADSVDDDSY